MNAEVVAVKIEGLCKAFPGVKALSDVGFSILAGHCHAIVGENGAGKSTLGKILAGLYEADSGEVRLFDQPVHFRSPMEATAAGVGVVHQELLFCENMSVEENLSLDAPPHKGWFLDRRALRQRASRWLSALDATNVDPSTIVGDLPIGMQQLVQIAGALGRGARVVIFDEPTSSLSQFEAERLFSQIVALKARGVTCIYVSHRLDEIFRLCDTATVLRDGRHVFTGPVSGLTRESIVRLMVGHDVQLQSDAEITPTLDTKLRVVGLSSPEKFENIGFELRAGEILGFAGLVGSGRTEVAKALFGLDPAARGHVEVNGQVVVPSSPSQMMEFGVGLAPEDRKHEGLVLGMNVRENTSLATLHRLASLGFIRREEEAAVGQTMFDKLGVRATGLEATVIGLSGGNQQKVVLGKWLAANPTVLLLDEPTRGVDVGAKGEIYGLVRQLAREGKAILVISSELPELLALANRIIVFRNRRIAGEVLAKDATEDRILGMMTGVRGGVSA